MKDNKDILRDLQNCSLIQAVLISKGFKHFNCDGVYVIDLTSLKGKDFKDFNDFTANTSIDELARMIRIDDDVVNFDMESTPHEFMEKKLIPIPKFSVDSKFEMIASAFNLVHRVDKENAFIYTVKGFDATEYTPDPITAAGATSDIAVSNYVGVFLKEIKRRVMSGDFDLGGDISVLVPGGQD